MNYFLFYNSGCDLEWDIKGPLTEKAILKEIEGYKEDEEDVVFCSKFPDLETHSDEQARVVIIRGNVIIPRATKVVEKYELP